MPKIYDVVYWETGKPAVIVNSWNSRTAAIADMESKADTFHNHRGHITRPHDGRIVWTSSNKRTKRAYYVRER